MFKDGGFEIYESTTKEYATKDIHDAIEAPRGRLLEVREILNQIKDRYYDIAEATSVPGVDCGRARLIYRQWVDQLSKPTRPVERRGVRQAMEELQEEGNDLTIDGRKRRKCEDREEEKG